MSEHKFAFTSILVIVNILIDIWRCYLHTENSNKHYKMGIKIKANINHGNFK